jgi:DNA polymerase III sliding clamp (beta) subunit (PCNA family)
MSQIQLLREKMVKALSGIKDDNVKIADVIIKRKPLLEALKLQTQDGADVLTLTYGKVSGIGNGDETCIQISCDHTVMRFLNRPKVPKWGEFDTEKIKTFNFGEYHEVQLSGMVFNPQELLNAIIFGRSSMANVEDRPPLYCLYIECDKGTVKFTSADGFRLSNISLQAKGIPHGNLLIQSPDVTKIINFLKSVKPIGKGKSKYYPDVYLSFDKKTLTLAITGDSITVENQGLTFPKYESLIPATGTKVEFIASELLQAVKALSPTAKNGSNIIRLEFNKSGKITLSSKSEEIGDTTAECDAIVEADGRIAFNGNYLDEYLSLCKDSKITGLHIDDHSPMVFTIDNTLAVIMPMFVQWGEPKVKAPEIEPDEIDNELDEVTDNELVAV